MLNAWNAALNAHDADALAQLYAPNLSFYGRDATRAQVVAEKRAAFARAPTFRQVLSAIQIVPTPNGGASAAFDKSSGTGPDLARVHGKLAIEARGAAYAIVLETDEPSEARANEDQSCLGTAMQVASTLPEVKKSFQAADPDARQGGVVYVDEGANASASLGFDHDDHFESVFGIELKSGELTVTEYGTPLSVPAADRAKVKAACRVAQATAP
jgi:hypothetical protein